MVPNESQLSLVEDLNEIGQKRDDAKTIWQAASARHVKARLAACMFHKTAKKMKKSPLVYRMMKSLLAKAIKNADAKNKTMMAKLRELQDLNEELQKTHIEASKALGPSFELKQIYVVVRASTPH
jgi:hypothetical protein